MLKKRNVIFFCLLIMVVFLLTGCCQSPTPDFMLTTPPCFDAHYFKITGDASMTAGGENIITITAYDQYDKVATGYNGDKTLIFSGAGTLSDSTISPTCSNKDNNQIDFGSDTIVTFTDGVGTSRMKLYKVETARIKTSSYQDFIDTISDFVVDVGAVVIHISAIPGVTIPVSHADPVDTITETVQYTGSVTWSPYEDPFLGRKIYTATITLTAKTGFTLTGVTENFFTVAGAEIVTNTAGSRVVTAVFPETALVVGDNYGGGIVAYIFIFGDPVYIPGEQHGLIAATKDQSPDEGIPWCDSFMITDATGTKIGDGQANTAVIVAKQGAGSYAAKLCDDLTEGGYDDWFLPSKDELYKLYLNKAVIGSFHTEGGFTSDSDSIYWSSSEDNKKYAWYEYFHSGYMGGLAGSYNSKKKFYRVRAVRSF